MRTRDDLRKLQALPLELKIKMTQRRIRDWVKEYGEDGVYVSFSGGKDSTVLLHIVREMYPNIEAVFINTGLEYPEIQRFVKSFDNVTILRPKMRFDEVIKRYGYPVISKEVSEAVYGSRRGWKSMQHKLHEKMSGGKWAGLEQLDCDISHMCCYVIKKKPAKEFEKRTGKKQITTNGLAETRL